MANRIAHRHYANTGFGTSENESDSQIIRRALARGVTIPVRFGPDEDGLEFEIAARQEGFAAAPGECGVADFSPCGGHPVSHRPICEVKVNSTNPRMSYDC